MGGIAFFSSLLSLLYLAILNPIFLFELIDRYSVYRFMWFFAGLLLGCWIADLLIRGHFSVFIHELKHSAVSNLVGNKFVSFMIRKSHGHFKYKYTKSTAKYNSIIALAPYFFPIITIPGLGIAFLVYHQSPLLAITLLGIFFGSDLLLSLRDIGDHQTDFKEIPGGFSIGILYVISMNLVISTILIAWIMQGKQGLKMLAFEHLQMWSSIFGLK